MSEQSPSQNVNVKNPVYEEAQIERVLESLRNNPTIRSEDLFSSNKMQSTEYPDRPEIKVPIDKPLDYAISSRSDVIQELSAVLGLGKKTAIGVVTARDKIGQKVRYISLITSNTSEEERAKPLGVLKPGEPLTVGRDLLQSVSGDEDLFSRVSRTHCTIELNDDVLTVIDEHSTNGTSLFTNNDNKLGRYIRDRYMWSQPSVETERLFSGEHETISEHRVADQVLAYDLAHVQKPFKDAELAFIKDGDLETAQKIAIKGLAAVKDYQDNLKAPQDIPELSSSTLETPSKNSSRQESSRIELNQAIELLSYGDVLEQSEKEAAEQWVKTSESGMKYAKELQAMINTRGEGLDGILKIAQKLKEECLEDMKNLGIPPSKFAKSNTWSLWDMAKQHYFMTHPDERSAEYNGKNYMFPFDPLASGRMGIGKRGEIIDRHLGWEADLAIREGRYKIEGLMKDVITPDIMSVLQNGERNETGQLRSFELAKLGRRFRRLIGKQESGQPKLR